MTRDRLGGLIFLAFSLAYGALSFNIELFPGSEELLFTARTLPLGLAAAGAIISLLMIVLPGRGKDEPIPLKGFNWAKFAGLCVLMVFYGAAVTRLGFIVSTSLFLIGGFLLLGERRWYIVVGVGVAVAVAFWVLLSRLLGIYLEPGLLI